MDKVLIKGSTMDILEEIREMKKEDQHLKSVTVFFDNANILITPYKLLSNGVHLILELENGVEIQIESANCGYYGAGPNATVEILGMFGLKEEETEVLIFYHDAVKFQVENDRILYKTLDTEYLFYSGSRPNEADEKLKNRIKENKSSVVDVKNGEVILYNPQRNCWNGFLCLLSYMKDMEMEYYIGSHSPIEGGLYVKENLENRFYWNTDRPDTEGIEHVNLVLSGSNFKGDMSD